MRINPITPYYQNYQYKTSAKPAFSGFRPFETIKHLNLGMADVGIIGKVRVFDSTGHDKFLNVVKDTGVCGTEIYMLKTNYGEIIGEMIMRITKDPPPHKVARTGEPSWVWVDFLRNYSNPNTKYYREGLPEYKGIGTRLLQIAQRRSDETMCGGNLHLCSKTDSKPFYERLGFEEIPTLYEYHQNKMYLPPHAKEPLSKLYGGL